MIQEILRKWFGLNDPVCEVCEVLRGQLERSERERHELLVRLLDPPGEVRVNTPEEEIKPIKPQHIPWRVRQQILEQEDRHKAKVMRDKVQEIADLEKELGVSQSQTIDSQLGSK